MSTDTAHTSARSPVPGDLVNSFIELLSMTDAPDEKFSVNIRNVDVQGEPVRIRWLRPTIEGLSRLPWDDVNPPDGRKPLEERAAGKLLWLLCQVMGNETIPPTSIVPTWRGGVTAEWHVNGFDLEIEADPSGTLEFSFAGPGMKEYEGPVDDNLDNIRAYVRQLPGARN